MIAGTVLGQIARIQSTALGESAPHVDTSKEPFDVLNWVENDLEITLNNPFRATAGDPDQIATDTDSAREELRAHFNRIFQRMRDFLGNNASFQWLKGRIHTIMTSSRRSVSTSVSRDLLTILEQGFTVANHEILTYAVDWDPVVFMHCNYDSYVDISSVISINSDGQSCEACTVGEYIARVWPITGPRVLEALQIWWMRISDGGEQTPFRRMYTYHSYTASTDHHRFSP